MIKSIRKTALAGAMVAAFVATGAASPHVAAATLLSLPSSTVSSGLLSPQTFSFGFSVTEMFHNLTLSLRDGSQTVTLPFVGTVPLLGALFQSATLTGPSYSDTVSGPQSLALGNYVNTFAGQIGPGNYSLQLTFLRAPLVATDFQGHLNAAVVPEPAEWMMMLGGLLIVGYAARRRAKGGALKPDATPMPMPMPA